MSCNKHQRETDLEEFKKELRDLIIYMLDEEDEDVVESYFQSFLAVFETYKNL